jgi:tetratricopeptide (TPR) repeat protein
MLHRSLLIFLTLLSLRLNAGSFDYLPASNPAEVEFRSLMDAGNYKQALAAWPTAHAGSRFALSGNGQATYAYLIYKNDLPFLGVQWLLQKTQPTNLDARLFGIWSRELRLSSYVQKGWITTQGSWKRVVNNEPVDVRMNSKPDVSRVFKLVQGLNKEDVNSKARYLWQIATRAPQIGDLSSALRALKMLKESGQTLIGQDLISLTLARVLYQKGDMEGALNAFHQVPKGSSLWIESVEERGWAHLRLEDYDKAVSETVTLMSPALSPLVGPESYFFANLTSLKICDYPRIFKTSALFKKRHRARLLDMQELAKSGTNKAIPSLMSRLEQKGVSLEGAGPLVEALPRAALRDARFVRFIESRRELLRESRRAPDLSLGAAAQSQADKLKQMATDRLRVLAQTELKEYKTVLNKLHIVEAEVIQRLAMDDNLKGERSKLAQNEKVGADVLVFPYEGDEVWFDELDNYKARVKDCPTLKGAGL